MHSAGIYRYYRKHRAHGWRRVSLPLAWGVLRLRAEIEWLRTRTWAEVPAIYPSSVIRSVADDTVSYEGWSKAPATAIRGDRHDGRCDPESDADRATDDA